jgi:two-component system response regulator DevR
VSEVPTSSRDLRVLVLEDAVDVRERLVSMITDVPGLKRPLVAGTVAEARAILLHAKPDVALLDLRLPDGSGLEIVRELRASNTRAYVAILTAFDTPQIRSSCLAAGANAFLSKTSGIEELNALLLSIGEREV